MFSSGPPEISPNEVQRGALLGTGSFGTVYQGTCRAKEVAVKVLHKQDLDPKTLHTFRKEVEIMSQISHPNVVLYMGACTQPGNMMIITELMPKGDLETLLQNDKISLSLLSRLKMMKSTALAMAWLHGSTPTIVHRDLKTSNLLLDENFQIKICDFGLSQPKFQDEFLKDGVEGAKGTPLWMAPEVLRGQIFNEKADVYSFGIVLWETLTRLEPFVEFEHFDDFRKAVCERHVRPEIPKDIAPSLKKLMEDCWDRNPQNRPAFQKVVERLDHIIIECATNDPSAINFWKAHFFSKDVVSWSDFITAFTGMCNRYEATANVIENCESPIPDQTRELSLASVFQLKEYANRSKNNAMLVSAEFQRRYQLQMHFQNNVQDNNLVTSPFGNPNFDIHLWDQPSFKLYEIHSRVLKKLFAEKPKTSEGVIIQEGEEVVTLERFGNMFDLFGPFCSHTFRVLIIEKMMNTLKKSWFFGDLGTKEAEEKLQNEEPGTFLVRLSTTHSGCYSLSKKSPTAITHQRILATPKGVYINNTRFDSLDQLIELSARELHLERPCPGSPYPSLFLDRISSLVTGYITSAHSTY